MLGFFDVIRDTYMDRTCTQAQNDAKLSFFEMQLANPSTFWFFQVVAAAWAAALLIGVVAIIAKLHSQVSN